MKQRFFRRLALIILDGLTFWIDTEDWCREWKKRWPAVIGVLRGKTVICHAHIGPPERHMVKFWNPRGTYMLNSSIDMGSVRTGVAVEIPAPIILGEGSSIQSGPPLLRLLK